MWKLNFLFYGHQKVVLVDKFTILFFVDTFEPAHKNMFGTLLCFAVHKFLKNKYWKTFWSDKKMFFFLPYNHNNHFERQRKPKPKENWCQEKMKAQEKFGRIKLFWDNCKIILFFFFCLILFSFLFFVFHFCVLVLNVKTFILFINTYNSIEHNQLWSYETVCMKKKKILKRHA